MPLILNFTPPGDSSGHLGFLSTFSSQGQEILSQPFGLKLVQSQIANKVWDRLGLIIFHIKKN